MVIRAGNLVTFNSDVRTWQSQYHHRSPGIVVRLTMSRITGSSAIIYWKNGETTTEHLSFLKVGMERS